MLAELLGYRKYSWKMIQPFYMAEGYRFKSFGNLDSGEVVISKENEPRRMLLRHNPLSIRTMQMLNPLDFPLPRYP